MKNKKIIFVTGNEKKYLAAKKYFNKSGFDLIRQKLDCPEVQNMDVCEVVKFSVKFMAEKLQRPVIKSDQGFYIEALNGFPGTYMNDVEKAIGKEGFKRIMQGVKNRKAKFVEALAFCNPGEDPLVFTAEKRGRLATGFQGKNGFGIDFLFILEGGDKTIASFPQERLAEVYDFKLWPKMIAFLKSEHKK
jgi:XTP/dITP diphosphohydrolase